MCSHDVSSVFVIVYMLSLLCLPTILAAIILSPYELVSLLDELPSLQTLVLNCQDSSARYVSLLHFCAECSGHIVCVLLLIVYTHRMMRIL